MIRLDQHRSSSRRRLNLRNAIPLFPGYPLAVPRQLTRLSERPDSYDMGLLGEVQQEDRPLSKVDTLKISTSPRTSAVLQAPNDHLNG